MSANLETAHRSLRALLPGRVSRGAGSIVVIGSRNVERPWTGASAAAYTASKAAVVALAQAVAAEVLASGVRVNAVLPSTLDTEANRRAMSSVDPKTPATPVVRAAPGSPAAVLAGDDLDAFDTMATAAAAQQAELGAKKQSCIAKGLALDRAMHGHVELAVSLEADGTVRASEVTSNRDLPPIVVACIRRAVTETHYLPPTNAAAFTRRESAGIP